MNYINLVFKSKKDVQEFLENDYKKYAEYGNHYFTVIGGGFEEIFGHMLIIEAKQANPEGWFQTVKKKNGIGYGIYWINGSWHDQQVSDWSEEQMIDFLWKNRRSARIPIIF